MFQKKLKVVKNPLYINKALAQPNGKFGHPIGVSNIPSKSTIEKRTKSFLHFLHSTPQGKEYLEHQRKRNLGENNPQYGKKGSLSPAFGRTGEKHPLFGKRKENNPNFGSKRTEQQKKNISESHHDCSGKNNSNATRWLLTSPTGDIIRCYGDLETVTSRLNIGLQLLKKHIGKVVPKLSKNATHPMSKNTVGWRLDKLS